MAKRGRPGKDEDELPKAKFSRENLKKTFRLFNYIRPHKGKFILGMFFLAGTAAVALIFPNIAGKILGVFGETNKSQEALTAKLTTVMIQLAIVLGLQGLVSYGRVFMFSLVSENMLMAIRKDVFTSLMKLPMSFYSKSSASEITSRIATDLSVVNDAFTTSLAEVVRQTVIVVGGTIMLVGYGSAEIALWFAAIIPAVAIITVFFARKIRKYSREQQDRIAAANVIVGEALVGISNVKSFTNEMFEISRYSKSVEDVRKHAISYAHLRGLFFSFIIVCVFGSIFFLLYKIVGLKIAQQISAETLGKFVMLSMFVAFSIGGLPEQIAQLQRGMGATERIFELMDEAKEDLLLTEQKKSHKLAGKVEFKGVRFYYPSRPDFPVLQGLTFNATMGQTIALVGSSGSGKSTIANLVLRFYDPTAGEILIDDKPYSNYDLTELRSNMAIVPQDVILFGGTIKENIEYGRPGASMEEIREAARQANALDFIESFPDKFETRVGDRGIQLSGGQRQRIAIARAVLKNPSILILDEATSSLDSESERLVQDALEKLMKGRTSIVIAHRLSTIRNADKIIVLERGKVKEEGTHAELINIPDGLYRSLSKLQYEVS